MSADSIEVSVDNAGGHFDSPHLSTTMLKTKAGLIVPVNTWHL